MTTANPAAQPARQVEPAPEHLAPGAAGALLEARHIGWERDGKTILRDIDFSLQAGECVGLIGPNGSGKSSLLKILAFLETPTSGTLYFHGQPLPARPPLTWRRRTAMVFQEPLLLSANVFDNVAVGLRMRGVARSIIEERVLYWLTQFGVARLRRQSARSLSGGEAQRVSLARAFVLEPELLFLDEPFSALDAPTHAGMRADLGRVFHEARTTIVLVSHDFQDIRDLTERVIRLQDGQIAAQGPTAVCAP